MSYTALLVRRGCWDLPPVEQRALHTAHGEMGLASINALGSQHQVAHFSLLAEMFAVHLYGTICIPSFTKSRELYALRKRICLKKKITSAAVFANNSKVIGSKFLLTYIDYKAQVISKDNPD